MICFLLGHMFCISNFQVLYFLVFMFCISKFSCFVFLNFMFCISKFSCSTLFDIWKDGALNDFSGDLLFFLQV